MKITKGAVIEQSGSTLKNKTGTWRTYRPVVDKEKCIGCGLCWLHCPDNSAYLVNKKSNINYDYCKGCGICANVCPVKAIKMVLEEK